MDHEYLAEKLYEQRVRDRNRWIEEQRRRKEAGRDHSHMRPWLRLALGKALLQAGAALAGHAERVHKPDKPCAAEGTR
ncbi:MAG: hypothetical protein KatS3mg057_2909 [Herpetosiphonaceae bacterium]|nr:MAG: hypothetical protein KatS3mg057_2909 [Herpetosiphonaceae bacterium]